MAKYLPHHPAATANALAVVSGALYVVCAAWVSFSRPTFMGMMGTWFHGINYQAIPYAPMMFTGIATGFLTFVIAAWLVGYAFAWMYNWFLSR